MIQVKVEVLFVFLNGMNVIWKVFFSSEKKRNIFFPNTFTYFFLKNESILPALFLVVLIHPNASSSHTENISICFKNPLDFNNGAVG